MRRNTIEHTKDGSWKYLWYEDKIIGIKRLTDKKDYLEDDSIQQGSQGDSERGSTSTGEGS